MARYDVICEDLDARDMLAETVFSALIKRGAIGDSYIGSNWRLVARHAYNAAEAFLDEREARLNADD